VEDRDGTVHISDRGITLLKVKQSGVDLTQSRLEWIGTICGLHGLKSVSGAFSKTINAITSGADCLSFCEAITRISTLEYDAHHRQKSMLPMLIEGLLKQRLNPDRKIWRNWTAEEHDFKKSFPVDYRFNGTRAARHLFHVMSDEKATLISAVSGFLKTHNIYVPTMSVVDQNLELGIHQLDRLQLASTEIKFGFSGNENQIVEFANA
jgi:hypothetical protein